MAWSFVNDEAGVNLVEVVVSFWLRRERFVDDSLELVCQACEGRIEDDEDGQKHCTGQYFDYWGCIDKCVSLS